MISDTKKIIVALDFNSQEQALSLVDKLDPELCRLKVGKEMFTHFGPSIVRCLVDRKFDVFLDLKFHDIPNTVGRACQAAADLGVWMLNVHASGGEQMMLNARKSLEQYASEAPLLIAVTILTSLSEQEIKQVGVSRTLNEQVLALAALSKECGMDGVVCSAQEAPLLTESIGNDFCLVTPGIRPKDSVKGDQTRVVTPRDAILAGADYLVIGRPITQASDPLKSLCDISESIQDLLA